MEKKIHCADLSNGIKTYFIICLCEDKGSVRWRGIEFTSSLKLSARDMGQLWKR